MDYYKIGQKIRKIRKAHGLLQEELAEKVNISTTHMSHIETGNEKMAERKLWHFLMFPRHRGAVQLQANQTVFPFGETV